MIAPGMQPTPRSGAVAAAPMPQPTAAPPTAPSLAVTPGLGVQAARASNDPTANDPAAMMIFITTSLYQRDAEAPGHRRLLVEQTSSAATIRSKSSPSLISRQPSLSRMGSNPFYAFVFDNAFW